MFIFQITIPPSNQKPVEQLEILPRQENKLDLQPAKNNPEQRDLFVQANQPQNAQAQDSTPKQITKVIAQITTAMRTGDNTRVRTLQKKLAALHPERVPLLPKDIATIETGLDTINLEQHSLHLSAAAEAGRDGDDSILAHIRQTFARNESRLRFLNQVITNHRTALASQPQNAQVQVGTPKQIAKVIAQIITAIRTGDDTGARKLREQLINLHPERVPLLPQHIAPLETFLDTSAEKIPSLYSQLGRALIKGDNTVAQEITKQIAVTENLQRFISQVVTNHRTALANQPQNAQVQAGTPKQIADITNQLAKAIQRGDYTRTRCE